MPVFYAELAHRRNLQFVADALLLTWIAGTVWLGRHVEQALAAPAETLRANTTNLARIGDDVADSAQSVGNLPLIGDRLSAPVSQIADSAQQLSSTARSVSDTLQDVARWAGLVTTTVLLICALLLWVPLRLHFVLGATRLRRIMRRPGAMELLALRALTTAPLAQLRHLGEDPVAAWTRRDPLVLPLLADMAVRSYGLTWHDPRSTAGANTEPSPTAALLLTKVGDRGGAGRRGGQG